MIALACDHGGFELMHEVKSYLDDAGIGYRDFGTFTAAGCDYPEIAERAANAIVGGDCYAGIFICGTGIGMSMAANKIPGIRAALCADCYMAEMTRRHNDSNVLCLGGRVTGAGHALKIVRTFLETDFDSGGRHGRRVEMLGALDARRCNTK